MNTKIVLFLLATVAGLNALPTLFEDPCATSIKKDVYYMKSDECDKFITCHENAEGAMYGEKLSCGFGTYWDDEKLVCVGVNQTACHNDKCANLEDGTILPAEKNCRGFWVCGAGRAMPHCCPEGQVYNNETAPCVEDLVMDCNDTCFYDYFLNNGNNTDNETIVNTCAMSPVPGNNKKYQMFVEGHGLVSWDCPAGTVFDSVKCYCDFDTSETHSVYVPTCKPHLNLTFSENLKDQSAYKFHIMDNSVQISDGAAFFDGVNSQLTIHGFSSLVQSSIFVIKLKYRSFNIHSEKEMAILSNGFDCGAEDSIRITESQTYVTFGAKTAVSGSHTVTVFNAVDENGAMLTEKEVVYKFNNNELKGINGNLTQSVTTNGYLVNTHCALTIGKAKGAEPFMGVIDQMTLYLCNPDDL